MYNSSSLRGVSLVEVIITAAIIAMVFGALLAGAQSMLQVVSRSKAKAAALSIASSQMEYARSFSYLDLGTVGGVPEGTIPQEATTTLNGIDFSVRTLVQYIDDPKDGVGAADSNGILSDYKQVKVEVGWEDHGRSDSIHLTSNIVPRGIETTAGGGTIRVNVFDSNVQPLSGAAVHFFNDTATSTIDTIRYTDPTGVAYLAGAPALADYEITVTDTGFSSDGTYKASITNPNPTPPPVAVLAGQVSTVDFQIDQLSTVVLTAKSVPTKTNYVDVFDTAAGLVSQASTTISGGAVRLANAGGVYKTPGVIVGTTTRPTTIDHWYKASLVASTSINTTVKLSVLYDTGGGLALVPDSDLPGNSYGFSTFPIDLTALDVNTYGALALQASLETVDTLETPLIDEWSLTYVEVQNGIAGVDATLTGSRSVGTDGDGLPVIKNSYSGTTDINGQWQESNVEFDVYALDITTSSYSIYELCPTSPLSVGAGEVVDVEAVLGPAAANNLRVNVVDVGGDPVADANVRLQNSGIDSSGETSLCGQITFASGLYADDGYLLTVSAAGYTTQNIASTTVSGESSLMVTLN